MSATTDEKQETKKGADVLQDIANITGKAGLYRIIKPGRVGVIIESLDEKHEKSIASATAKVSVLKDVSVYVEDAETESVSLSEVFFKIREIHGDTLDLDPKRASDKDLVEFLAKALPNYDRSKVYNSDIRKIITWYGILSRYTPDLFAAPDEKPDAVPEKTVEKGKKKA